MEFKPGSLIFNSKLISQNEDKNGWKFAKKRKRKKKTNKCGALKKKWIKFGKDKKEKEWKRNTERRQRERKYVSVEGGEK